MLGADDYAQAIKRLLPQAGAYAQSYLRHRGDAEDAVQAAALRGLERIAGYDTARPFKGWWFAILRNICLDRLRSSKRTRFVVLPDNLQAPPATEPEAPVWAGLDQAIAALSETHREIVRLRYFGDLSYAEIAQSLAIPPGTVMSRLHAARQALAAALTEAKR